MKTTTPLLLTLTLLGCGGGNDPPPPDLASTACETMIHWAHGGEQVCVACAAQNCAAEYREYGDREAVCKSQFAAAWDCMSRYDCICTANAVTATDCKATFDKLTGCFATKCSGPCK